MMKSIMFALMLLTVGVSATASEEIELIAATIAGDEPDSGPQQEALATWAAAPAAALPRWLAVVAGLASAASLGGLGLWIFSGSGPVPFALALSVQGLLAVAVRGRVAPDALPEGPAVVEVEDTTRALADVARGHRAGFRGALVGLTGSSGKTTTKELIHSVLASRGPCLKTHGNLNNEFGLPLSLLRRESGDWAGVVNSLDAALTAWMEKNVTPPV